MAKIYGLFTTLWENWKYYLCLRLLSISTSTCPIPWPEFISFLLQSLHFTPSVPFPPSPFLSSNLFLMVRSDDSNHVFDHALSGILFYFCVIPLPPQNCFLVAFPTLCFFVSVSPCQSICMHIDVQMHIHTQRNLQNLAEAGVTLSKFFSDSLGPLLWFFADI